MNYYMNVCAFCPGDLGIVLDLVHDVDGVAAVVVHRLKQGNGVLDGFQGKHHVLPGNAQFLGHFLHGGLQVQRQHQPAPGLQRLIGGVPQGTADPDGLLSRRERRISPMIMGTA